jgi:hypothetical protein
VTVTVAVAVEHDGGAGGVAVEHDGGAGGVARRPPPRQMAGGVGARGASPTIEGRSGWGWRWTGNGKRREVEAEYEVDQGEGVACVPLIP